MTAAPARSQASRKESEDERQTAVSSRSGRLWRDRQHVGQRTARRRSSACLLLRQIRLRWSVRRPDPGPRQGGRRHFGQVQSRAGRCSGADFQRHAGLQVTRKRNRVCTGARWPPYLPRFRLRHAEGEIRRRRAARQDGRHARGRLHHGDAEERLFDAHDVERSRGTARRRPSGALGHEHRIRRREAWHGFGHQDPSLRPDQGDRGLDRRDVVGGAVLWSGRDRIGVGVEDAHASFHGHRREPDAIRRHPCQAAHRRGRDGRGGGRRCRRRAADGARNGGAASLEGEPRSQGAFQRRGSRKLQDRHRGDRGQMPRPRPNLGRLQPNRRTNRRQM